jgi:tRNA pseudouridine38-40 synthase
VYALLHRKDRSALLAHRAYHVYGKLDLDRMREGASHLIGEHDFRSFCGMLPEGGITIRTVKSLEIDESGEYVRVQISADGFLHRMVRTIVGTLVECGLGRRDPAMIPNVLAAKARKAAGLTAPAHGLYLAGVKYEDGYDSYAEPPVFSWRSST